MFTTCSTFCAITPTEQNVLAVAKPAAAVEKKLGQGQDSY